MGLFDFFKKKLVKNVNLSIDFPTNVVVEYHLERTLAERLCDYKGTRELCDYFLKLFNCDFRFIKRNNKSDELSLLILHRNSYKKIDYTPRPGVELSKEVIDYKNHFGFDFAELRDLIKSGEAPDELMSEFAGLLINKLKSGVGSLDYCDKDLVSKLFDYGVRNDYFLLTGPSDNRYNCFLVTNEARTFLRVAAGYVKEDNLARIKHTIE